jgi:hypothetical protein
MAAAAMSAPIMPGGSPEGPTGGLLFGQQGFQQG